MGKGTHQTKKEIKASFLLAFISGLSSLNTLLKVKSDIRSIVKTFVSFIESTYKKCLREE